MSILSDLLLGVLRIDPSAEAVDYQGKWYTWGDLATAVGSITACLGELGLGEGARVGVMMRTRPDALAGLLAAVANEGSIVSINPLYPDERLCADLESLRLPVVVGETEDLERTGVLDTLAKAGTAVIQLAPVLKAAALRPGYDAIAGDSIDRTNPEVIIEMLTSGTTGTPKRVPLKREAFERSFLSALSYERNRSPDDPPQLRPGTQLLTNPLTHIGGLWGALTTILGGRKLCVVEKFSVEAWRDAVVRHRPKVASAVPAGLRMLLDADIPAEDLSSLVAIRTGAAPLDPAIVAEFWERYRIPVLQNYGATELSGAVAGWSLADFKAHHEDKVGSVGRFQPGVTGRIVDPETGEEVAPGEDGILEMKAAQFGNNNEWLRTTDRAMIDLDGFLFIRGRADNAIIRGGFKVHPDDVVAVLEQHPAVREAVVVGIKDRRLGAVPAAAIIFRSNAEKPTEAELAAFAREHMLPYQVPVKFLFLDDVPRTPSMKPSLPMVAELFEQAAGASA
jgi:acyl-CoA synthetase (AMP-forming)/AMP-acid ligase II